MRSVRRSPEPAFLADLRVKHSHWDDLQGYSRGSIRDALRRDFGPICAYCQQSCQLVRRPPNQNENEVRLPPDEESIDHFRPRKKFPSLQFDWLNLIYACYRCNQSKGGSWPGCDDPSTDERVAGEGSGYMPVTEYVNPNALDGRQPAGEFFDFNVETGEMMPSEQLDRVEWYIAHRTIRDIDLNDTVLGENDPSHLWNQRRYQVYLLTEVLEAIENFDAKVRMMLAFMATDKPFSAFISTYVAVRFPLFVQLFQRL